MHRRLPLRLLLKPRVASCQTKSDVGGALETHLMCKSCEVLVLLFGGNGNRLELMRCYFGRDTKAMGIGGGEQNLGGFMRCWFGKWKETSNADAGFHGMATHEAGDQAWEEVCWGPAGAVSGFYGCPYD